MTGLEIKDFLESQGWKQERFAAELGVTQSTVSRWISKGAIPGPKHQEAIKRLMAAHGGWTPPASPANPLEGTRVGDVPLSAEAAKLLTDMVDRFLGAYHPLALRLWREAIERANPFPEDIALSGEDRERLLKEAELQGHRARLRSNRQTD